MLSDTDWIALLISNHKFLLFNGCSCLEIDYITACHQYHFRVNIWLPCFLFHRPHYSFQLCATGIHGFFQLSMMNVSEREWQVEWILSGDISIMKFSCFLVAFNVTKTSEIFYPLFLVFLWSLCFAALWADFLYYFAKIFMQQTSLLMLDMYHT